MIMMVKGGGDVLWISSNIDVLAGCGIWQATRHSLIRHVTLEGSWRSQIISSDQSIASTGLYPRDSVANLLSRR